jgi:hypothetical protein
MAAAAHDPKFAAKAGVPPVVAKDFNQPIAVRLLRQALTAAALRKRGT